MVVSLHNPQNSFKIGSLLLDGSKVIASYVRIFLVNIQDMIRQRITRHWVLGKPFTLFIIMNVKSVYKNNAAHAFNYIIYNFIRNK